MGQEKNNNTNHRQISGNSGKTKTGIICRVHGRREWEDSNICGAAESALRTAPSSCFILQETLEGSTELWL